MLVAVHPDGPTDPYLPKCQSKKLFDVCLETGNDASLLTERTADQRANVAYQNTESIYGALGKGSLDALKWAIKYIVGSNDTLVKLDIRLAAGFESKFIAVAEAQKHDPRWIVLDGHIDICKHSKADYSNTTVNTGYAHQKAHTSFKNTTKQRALILSQPPLPSIDGPGRARNVLHSRGNTIDKLIKLAVQTKGVATLIPSKITGPESEEWQTVCKKIDDIAFTSNTLVEEPHLPEQPPSTPSSYPLSWRTGFPRTVFLLVPGEGEGLGSVIYGGGKLDGLGTKPSTKAATNLLWNYRWGIALDIGEAIRYLHEDFVDGSIVNLSLCSSNVGLARASSDMVLAVVRDMHLASPNVTQNIPLSPATFQAFPGRLVAGYYSRRLSPGIIEGKAPQGILSERLVPYEAFACPCGSGDVVLRESYKPKTREERVRVLVGSSGASTTLIHSPGSSSTPIYSPGASTTPIYSPGSSLTLIYSPRALRNAECSNCKHLLDKITVLEAMLEMYKNPEQHTLNLAALLHEVYNDMGKLDLE
ncbi:hypothetical protein Tco_1370279 [Tanacetum coccineum]